MEELYTEEQLQELKECINKILDPIRELWEKIKQAFNSIFERIKGANDNLRKIEPKKRYGIVKKLGIEHYEMFFNRTTTHRCRNNC